jgi:hypothetical protein
MIQTLVIAIPGLVALIVCLRRGPERAFLIVYLPALLLLPQHFGWTISGQLTFADTAMLPIAAYLLLWSKTKWQWSTIDVLVIAYIAIGVVAEGMNKGYKLGSQNVALQEVCSIFLPYFAAKQMFRHPEFAVDVAKRVAALLAVVAIVSVYEFRMGLNLFTWPFESISPAYGAIRGGYTRIAGPYYHALSLGLMMAFAFQFARWLEWNGVWKDRMHFLPISKVRFCELAIAAGSIMSLSRGPWLAAACGAVVVAVCRAQNRKRAILWLVLVTIVIGGPIYTRFNAYVSVDPMAARDVLQEDAAYRNKLIPAYIPVIEERATWGWGVGGFPVVEGMWSVDNGYLFMALTWGVYALAIMVALFVWPPIRLAMFSLPLRRNDPRALAAFSMISIFVMYAVMDFTASGGGAPWTILIIVTGWTATLLKAAAPELAVEEVWSSPRTQLEGFRRVMV